MKYRQFTILFLILSLSACNFESRQVSNEELTISPPSQGSTPGTQRETNEDADIIFHNGNIITMDQTEPAAEAIAVRRDTIQAVGSNAEILALQGTNTAVIDLEGRTLMPGFVDAHSHLLGEHLLYDQDPLPDHQMAIEYGITTAAEFYVDESILNKLVAQANSGKLRTRVNAYLLYTSNCGEVLGAWWKSYQPNQQIAPNLYVRGIKIFADGGSCKIPAMSVEYLGGGAGDLFFTQEQMSQMVADVQNAGFQAAVHALGDRALEQAQNAIAKALNGNPNTYRHRIEHNATIRPDLLPRYGEIGIIPVIFGAYPTCIRTTDESQFKYLLSSEYGAWEWPWRALVDANPGLPIAWQADYPLFESLNPLYHAWGMVTRRQANADGSVCDPPEWLKAGALRIEEVLPMMTRNAAYSLFFESEVGSLETGKFADLIVPPENPLSVEENKLKDIKVIMTMIGGKVEHCATGSESLCDVSPDLPPANSTVLSPSTVTASASLPENPPAHAVDGDIETIWNSGAHPEQWIQLDLGQPSTVSAIRLVVSQFPEGETMHQIWADADVNHLALVHEFKGITKDPQVLEFSPETQLAGIQLIRILSLQSPSWVAWREIEVFGYKGEVISTSKPVIDTADVIYFNGTILTMEKSQPTAEAIAVKGESILAVGNEADVMSFKGDDTRLIDLQGLTLTPGFIDSHAHRIGDRWHFGDVSAEEMILYIAASPDGIHWSPRVQITSEDYEKIYATIVGLDGNTMLSDESFYIYNTHSSIGGIRRWDFDTDGDTEGWIPQRDLDSFEVGDGNLVTRSTGIDLHMGSPKIAIRAETYPVITIRMKLSAGNEGQMFFTTDSDPRGSEGKSLRFRVDGHGEFFTYTLEMSRVPTWQGVILSARLDPLEVSGAEILVDWIEFRTR